MARYIDAGLLLQQVAHINSTVEQGVKYFNSVYNLIQKQPTADVEEVKHGEWKRINHGTICTNCYRVFDNDFEFSNKDIRTYFKRCPECGAKMEENKK